MFLSHALLLRGTLYTLWREDEKALKDLQEVINTQGQNKEVGSYSKMNIILWYEMSGGDSNVIAVNIVTVKNMP